MSVALYKSLEAANSFIGATSLLYLPWSLKFLWAPLVDSVATKRKWILTAEFILSVLFLSLALFVRSSDFLAISVAVFSIAAFVSATHDIAVDGFYMLSLDKKTQAFFTGTRAAFYRLSIIFGGGILVSLAGAFDKAIDGWSVSFSVAAALFFALFLYHKAILPYPDSDKAARTSEGKIAFAKAFKFYFAQPNIGAALAYILLYRLGEAILTKMAQPFLLDPPEKGGLGFSLSETGLTYGTIGVLFLVAGGIIGGWLVKKYSLKKLILPMALAMNLPNLLYVYLAAVQPTSRITIDLSFLASNWIFSFNWIATLSIVIEQFGYGLGFAAYMVFMLYISKEPYKTTSFALSTCFMALGMMIPGFFSGFLQESLGYLDLFILSALLTLPGMATIKFLKFQEED